MRVRILAALIATLHVATAGAQSPRPSTQRLTEIQRISGAEHDLSVVGSVTRAADGTIWISQPQDGQILGYRVGVEGRRVLGRRGQGPGEFAIVSGFANAAGRIWVYDGQLRRLTRLEDAPGQVTTMPVSMPTGLGTASSVVAVTPGFAIHRTGGGPRYLGASPDPEGDPVVLFATELNGSGSRVLASFRSRPCGLTARTGNGRSTVGTPFCHRAIIGTSPNGAFLVVAEPFVERKSTTGVTVTLYSTVRGLRRTSSHLLGESVIPRTVRDSAADALRARTRPETKQLNDAILSDDLIPTTYPPVQGVVVADDGTAWVTFRSGSRGEYGVLVIRSDGTSAGPVPLSAGSRIGWADERMALVVEEQEDGLQDVVLYRLSRR